MFKEGLSTDRPRGWESRRSSVVRSIPPHDVVAASPHFLPVPINPMSGLPDVIPVARPISGTTSVIRAITDCHRNRSRISTIVRPAVIWSAIIRTGARVGTIAGITSVVVCAARNTKRGNKQHEVSHFHFHLYEYSESGNELRVSVNANFLAAQRFYGWLEAALFSAQVRLSNLSENLRRERTLQRCFGKAGS